jgi:hypothetical protein
MSIVTQKLSDEGPDLYLDFHGRIIEHLGLQMYQSPTAALAEMVSNAWDADATRIEIRLPTELGTDAEIVIQDFGNGMTLAEVQAHYLKVGLNRRGAHSTERSRRLNRAILGRKGIGKFAGFGIARRIIVETISQDTGEKTTFELNYDRIRGGGTGYVNSEPLKIVGATHEAPDAGKITEHGTTIRLASLSLSRTPSADQMRTSMSRRFSFGASISDFEIFINGIVVPADADEKGVQFSFPRDYEAAERPDALHPLIDGEWGVEELPDANVVRWRYRFYEEPINESELAGVAIFASGKVAQMPFLFNLAGGLGGQHGAAYMSGRVEADFLDGLPRDVIAPERQRIDWEAGETKALLDWGQSRTKDLLRLWKSRRGETRRKRLAERLKPIQVTLDRLSSSDRKPLETLLAKLSMMENLDDAQFVLMSDSLVTAWKNGRLKNLIERLGDADVLDEAQMLQILLEADMLSDLQMAEVARTRMDVVRELRRRIELKDVEGALRDHIAEHPFLISPRWATFARERRVNSMLEEAASLAKINLDPEFQGRLDLALGSNETLLIVEFMRPGITLDVDHIQRFRHYIAEIKPIVRANTVLGFSRVIGYIIADNTNRRAAIAEMISEMRDNEQYVMTWKTMLDIAEAEWQEQLDILGQRSGDERIAELVVQPPPPALPSGPVSLDDKVVKSP